VIITKGLSSVTVDQPYYGYKVVVTPKISRVEIGGTNNISFYDYGSEFDQWVLEVPTNILTKTQQTAFESFISSDIRRGTVVTMSALDGFYPSTPLYGYTGSFGVIFLPDKFGHGKQQDKPYLYWSSKYTALISTRPSAVTVDYTSDNGHFRIGSVDNLRCLQYHADSTRKSAIGYSTQFKTLSATSITTVDLKSDSDVFETKFELELSGKACAAIVKYFLIDRNLDDIEIEVPANTWLFGVGIGESDGSGTFKVHITNEDFEFDHFEFNRWRVTINARYYETV
jgi:hypothetical protein